MGHSLVSFHDQHIHCKDYLVETWLWLMVRQIDYIPHPPAFLQQMRSRWKETAEICINGCVDPQLDEFLDDEYKVQSVATLAIDVITQVRSFGERIPASYLNELCQYPEGQQVMGDRASALHLEFSIAILKLITGKQTEKLVKVYKTHDR